MSKQVLYNIAMAVLVLVGAYLLEEWRGVGFALCAIGGFALVLGTVFWDDI